MKITDLPAHLKHRDADQAEDRTDDGRGQEEPAQAKDETAAGLLAWRRVHGHPERLWLPSKWGRHIIPARTTLAKTTAALDRLKLDPGGRSHFYSVANVSRLEADSDREVPVSVIEAAAVRRVAVNRIRIRLDPVDRCWAVIAIPVAMLVVVSMATVTMMAMSTVMAMVTMSAVMTMMTVVSMTAMMTVATMMTVTMASGRAGDTWGGNDCD